MSHRVVLLGPQRFAADVPRVMADLGHEGPVATVAAGWGEREGDDDELTAAVGGQGVPLGLYARWRDVVERDPDFADADRARRDRLEDLRGLYLVRLHHAIEAVAAVRRHDGDPAAREDALADTVEAIRALDHRHLRRVAAVDEEFWARWRPHDRPVVARHREEVARRVARSGAVAIAGGHVGLLARCLHLFNLAAVLGDRPVVAWSAGAMAVTDRVVLFHDRMPHGPGHVEVLGRGIGLVRDAVVLPHAARRLDLDDEGRVELLERRFAPRTLVRLDDGARVDVRDGVLGPVPALRGGAADPRPRRDGGRGRTSVVTAEVDPTARAVAVPTVAPATAKGRLAIDDLRDREAELTASDVDAFLAARTSPIIEGDRATFLFRGDADEVLVQHRVVGLPHPIRMQRLGRTRLWYAVVHLPPRSRVEYHLEVVRDGHGEHRNDPLNPHLARNPMGSESVARAEGYDVPDWVLPDPETRPGELREVRLHSRALGRDVHAPLYLPARFRPTHRYPLLVVHDGQDYLDFASMQTVLDNLVHRLDVAEVVAVFLSSRQRLTEYADDPAHAAFVMEELVPHLEAELPLVGAPRGRTLMGASFGAIASFSTALRYPGEVGSLLLQSTSFAVVDIGEDVGEDLAVFRPVVDMVRRYRAEPVRLADRIYQTVGAYEPMIRGNRAMVPVLQGTGATVRYVEARDGHNWENWRDRLRDGLSWLHPGPVKHVYE